MSRVRQSLLDSASDLRLAARGLLRELRFTLTLIAILALGMGGTVAVFTVVKAYLLDPLPFPSSDRLVRARPTPAVPYTEVDDLFEYSVSWDLDAFTLVDQERPEVAFGAWVTPDFFAAHGVEAQIGRTLRSDESGSSATSVVMISHDLWQRRYGGSDEVLGQQLAAYTSDRPEDAELFEIVGVLPEDFWFYNRYTDVLAPLRASQPIYTGTLREGVTAEHAAAELTRRSEARTATALDEAVQLIPVHEAYVQDLRPTLLLLMTGVGLVFLTVCTNAAILLLVRGSRRSRELAVRRALGAGSWRLVRQLLAEGLVPALAAAALALGLAATVLDRLSEQIPQRLGRTLPGGADSLSIDLPALAAVLALTVVVATIFALAPLLGAQVERSVALGGGRSATDSRSQRNARGLLIAGEIALSLALLIAAGLVLRSAVHLHSVDLGFSPTGVVAGQVGLRQPSYPLPEDRLRFFTELEQATAQLPSVAAAGLISTMPFIRSTEPARIEIETSDSEFTNASAIPLVASRGYFQTYQIPLLRGRLFDRRDAREGPPVALISAELALRLWGEQDPIGRRLRPATDPMAESMGEAAPARWYEIVGVVGSTIDALGEDPAAAYYLAASQEPRAWMGLAVRRSRNDRDVVSEIEAVLAGLDPTVPFSQPQDASQTLSTAFAPTRFLASLLGAFAIFAVTLSVTALYGVVAYAASLRRREVAIRLALGAQRTDIIGQFVRQGLPAIVAGLAGGIATATLFSRGLARHLYGVDPTDPPTVVALTVLLGTAALLAVWFPARRAARVEPATILHQE